LVKVKGSDQPLHHSPPWKQNAALIPEYVPDESDAKSTFIALAPSREQAMGKLSNTQDVALSDDGSLTR
jgi:hypothetical protein